MTFQKIPLLDLEISLEKKIRNEVSHVLGYIFQQVETDEWFQKTKDFFQEFPQVLPFLEKKSPIRANVASFDFHIQNNTPQLIEFSLFPPGCSFLGEYFTESSEEKEEYVKQIMEIFAPYERIAITDHILENQHLFEEFLFLKKKLEDQKKTVFLAEATGLRCMGEEIQVIPWQEGVSSGEYEVVDFIANRLPFSDYIQNPDVFSGFAEAIEKFPQKFLTDFQEWILSEKHALLFFQDNEFLKKFIPKTMLSGYFNNIEEVKEKFSRNSVLKPLFSHGGQNIFIKPSNRIIQNILDMKKNYLFQELIPAPKLEDGRKFDLRVLVTKKKNLIFLARVYEGAITNFRNEGSGWGRVRFE